MNYVVVGMRGWGVAGGGEGAGGEGGGGGEGAGIQSYAQSLETEKGQQPGMARLKMDGRRQLDGMTQRPLQTARLSMDDDGDSCM